MNTIKNEIESEAKEVQTAERSEGAKLRRVEGQLLPTKSCRSNSTSVPFSFMIVAVFIPNLTS